MKSHWRKLAALLPLPLERKIYRRFFKSKHNDWMKEGRQIPPSHLSKQQLLLEYAQAKNHAVLVETGTYLGDMIFAMTDNFEHIYSIELSNHFYKKAKHRFRHFPNVHLIEGDSGKILSTLVPQIKRSAIFWLDGHYSGGQTAKGEKDCPIFEELKSILSDSFEHTVLIDDARLFVGKDDYPTIDELKAFVLGLKPGSTFDFKNDAIIIKIHNYV